MTRARQFLFAFAALCIGGGWFTYQHYFSLDHIHFKPSQHDKRGWFINPGGMNKEMSMPWIFAAIIPAIFVGILLFMETEMTGVLLSKKEHKLAKGPGYNMDMCVVGVLAFGSSLLGLPWMCADTVRSASHVNALSIWSTSHAPGEKPHLIEVKEQRISNIIVHVLTGELKT